MRCSCRPYVSACATTRCKSRFREVAGRNGGVDHHQACGTTAAADVHMPDLAVAHHRPSATRVRRRLEASCPDSVPETRSPMRRAGVRQSRCRARRLRTPQPSRNVEDERLEKFVSGNLNKYRAGGHPRVRRAKRQTTLASSACAADQRLRRCAAARRTSPMFSGFTLPPYRTTRSFQTRGTSRRESAPITLVCVPGGAIGRAAFADRPNRLRTRTTQRAICSSGATPANAAVLLLLNDVRPWRPAA